MKIGIVCYPTFGGSGAIATELGQSLARRDHEVHLISYAPPFRLREFRPNLQFHAVEVSSYPLFRYPPYDLALASKVMAVAESTGLDVLHVHYAIPHSISAYLAREMMPGNGIKVITTLHGTDITIVGTERSYHAITRFGIEKSDGVTTVSHWLKEETERIFGVGREMRVIPNFVDEDRFVPLDDPEFRGRFCRPEEKLIVHASNFRPVKRVPDVVLAFSKIREQMPAKLVLVGDGPDLHRAAELTDELGIRKSVIFAGQQRSVEQLLGVADLFFLPSESESFGLSALESMACGTPVIATRTGGITEVVVDGETGRLCPLGDTDCMAEFAIELLADEVRHEAFREAARRSAVDRFSEKKIIREYEEYYAEILG